MAEFHVRESAVTVREACLNYGSKKKPNVILDHLNMTVPRGSIYGLLGASGCGKTSLLTCIVGIRKLKAGHICVLGGEPGTPGSGVPGPRIGYMPQDIALMGDFTISNTMFYFGRIFGMKYKKIKERSKFLHDLLQLPPETSFVGQLSGGQQRRVSLAAALLHDPELLILDEPTVGLDPILRQRIWDYLKEITQVDNKSVIITTHYIEEARQADVIGMMRRGKLLAEDPPSRLLERHACDTLELVFLELSRAQSLKDDATSRHPRVLSPDTSPMDLPQKPEAVVIHRNVSSESERQIVNNVINEMHQDEISTDIKSITTISHSIVPVTKKKESMKPSKKKKTVNRASFCDKMHSLLKKNFLRYIRNGSTLAYVVGFPILQIAVFFLAIGHDPWQLNLAVVNDEIPKHLAGMCEPLPSCNMTRLSCRFLNTLSPETVRLQHFGDKEGALAAVKAGHAWGALYFGTNFSSALNERYEEGVHTSDMTLAEGEIDVWLDMTDHHIGLLLKKTLLESYREFSKSLLVDCGLNGKQGDVPMQFGEPIYGSKNPSYTLFMAPGVILTVVYFLGVGVTCTTMVAEMTDGIWNRALVSGVTTAEIMLSHVITQFSLMLVQTAECLLLSFIIFGVVNKGSLGLVIALTIMEGFCGISYGILISVVCDTMTSAIFLGLGSFFPILMLCGITWPVEGMPRLLRLFCEQLPLTSGSVALRNILGKGWGIYYPAVYKGFALTSVWTAGFLILCLIVLRVKK